MQNFHYDFCSMRRNCQFSACSSDKYVCAIPSVEKGQMQPVEADSLTRKLLDTYKCYILDCGAEVFVWTGRNTSLDQRKIASEAADVISCAFWICRSVYISLSVVLLPLSFVQELLATADRPKARIIRLIEGFETITFRSKFDSWHQPKNVAVTEEGRGKVAGLQYIWQICSLSIVIHLPSKTSSVA